MRFDQATGVLYITDAHPDDAGEYVCSASNALGRGSATATLEYIGWCMAFTK
jgi:hypothetical protein